MDRCVLTDSRPAPGSLRCLKPPSNRPNANSPSCDACTKAIDSLIERAAEDGYRTINLEGKSEVDFLVEHACSAAVLEYRRRGDAAAEPATLRLLGERESRGEGPPHAGADTGEIVHLWNVLLEADEGRSFGG